MTGRNVFAWLQFGWVGQDLGDTSMTIDAAFDADGAAASQRWWSTYVED
jgi:hypothetical protein